MKRFLAISLLSFYILSITELNQLVKLPLLFEHYNEHKEKDSKITLLEFLSKHYAEDEDNDGDEDKEMKLPFKSHDGCINNISNAFVSNNFEGLFIKPNYSKNKPYYIYTEQFLTSTFLSSIWQPPKSC
ncbi:MAG: hypothetical protein Q7W45_02630 [Bacteroidota bacterium]|nr:hypothetical protein [Bacteroidota bacterium]MDP3145851.1 hypothetical protein [Bacteroidota bacterium]